MDIIFSADSICQIRYKVTVDTIKNSCEILQIDSKSKTFAVHSISDCRKVAFYDANKLIAYWSGIGICKLVNISKGFDRVKPPVSFMNIEDILGVELTDRRVSFYRDKANVSEHLYVIKYIDKTQHLCEMKVDKYWFMIFKNECK